MANLFRMRRTARQRGFNLIEAMIIVAIMGVLYATVGPMARHGGDSVYVRSLLFIAALFPFMVTGGLVAASCTSDRTAHRVCPLVAGGALIALNELSLPFIAFILPFLWRVNMTSNEIAMAMAATAAICLGTASISCGVVRTLMARQAERGSGDGT